MTNSTTAVLPLHGYIGGSLSPSQAVSAAARWTAQFTTIPDLYLPARSVIANNVAVAALVRRGAAVSTWRNSSANRQTGAPLIAVAPNFENLCAAIDMAQGRALCVTQPYGDEMQAWVGGTKPTCVAGEALQPLATADSVVRTAIESVGAMINQSSGLGHPSDKAAAADALVRLQAAGYEWSTPSLLQSAFESGWAPNAVFDLQNLSTLILSGRRPKYQGGLAADVVAQWEAETQEAARG
ncbi:hypothetical protein [Salinibacterium sp. ZJ450]|uniref:hypothetical protein n=1 Tax=Salinibacterium sp. ZJ450 TaxID=2708338 RepID=UPI0014223278|nr:hypothetical protein [Salinibacterium sp. ZJ450]